MGILLILATKVIELVEMIDVLRYDRSVIPPVSQGSPVIQGSTGSMTLVWETLDSL